VIRFPISLRAIAAAGALLTATACGGTNPSLPATSSPPQEALPAAPQTDNATATMTIAIPAKAANAIRNPKYISASTQSMTVSLVDGNNVAQLAEIDLTPSSAHCSAQSGGLQCTASIPAPAGKDTFKLSMYDQTGGKGNLLSTGSVAATLVAGQATAIPMVLGGVPATATVILGTSTLPVGNAGSTSALVQAEDADGNLIIGPGAYANPITLTIAGDSYKTLSLSTSTVTTPGQAITLSYNGGSNVASTITPSGTGITGTAATFNGTGASLTQFQYADITNGIYLFPYDVAAFSNGTAAVLGEIYGYGTNGLSGFYYVIAVASPNGVQKVFIGDSTDALNPPATAPSYSGLTVVHGMSQVLNVATLISYDNLAVNQTTGTVYYAGSTNTVSYPGCQGTAQTGTIGALNPSTGTATEEVLKGQPGPIRVDGSGNVWWIEESGHCLPVNTPLLTSGPYAIGELSASGTLTETPFSAAALTSVTYPTDMSIDSAGTSMYIGDYFSSQIFSVALNGTPSAGVPVALVNSKTPTAIATSSLDGTTLWFSNDEALSDNYYGWIPGSQAFSGTNLNEAPFRQSGFYAETMAYADGSFWLAGDVEGSGIGRISGASGSSPENALYPAAYNVNAAPEYIGISAAGGYVWATDSNGSNIAVMQYGAPQQGLIAYNKVRRIGTMVKFPPPPRTVRARRPLSP
jgi:hypothetical protein